MRLLLGVGHVDVAPRIDAHPEGRHELSLPSTHRAQRDPPGPGDVVDSDDAPIVGVGHVDSAGCVQGEPGGTPELVGVRAHAPKGREAGTAHVVHPNDSMGHGVDRINGMGDRAVGHRGYVARLGVGNGIDRCFRRGAAAVSGRRAIHA
jgi:hypothetical protein